MNEDDGADTARNVTAAQKLVEEEKVFAIMPESAAGDASGKYLHDEGIPAVGWQLGLAVYGTYPNFFGMQNANAKDIQTHYRPRPIEAVKALGAKKIAVIGNSTGNSGDVRQAERRLGEEDQGPEARLRDDRHPDRHHRVRLGGRPDQAVGCRHRLHHDGRHRWHRAREPAEAGRACVPKIIVFPGGYSPAVLGLPAFDNAYFSLEFAPLETTPEPHGITEYKKWMAQEAPSAQLGQTTMVGWISGDTMIEGIKAAGLSCPTRKAFINNLRLVKGYTADGFFPPMNFPTSSTGRSSAPTTSRW